MKRSRLLQIVSYLMIVLALFTLVVDIMAIAKVGPEVGQQAGSVGVGVFVTASAYILPLATNLVMLIAGVLGAMHWNNPAKSGSSAVFGFLALALNIVSVVLAINNGGFSTYAITTILMLLLPIAYLIGVFQLRK